MSTFDFTDRAAGTPFVTMPKKSRRRAKTGGGSGGSKAPGGGGGAGRGGADKNQPTAKNSDENSAGILTAGAVRMFSECAKDKAYSVPKNSAPVLQIVSDVKEGIKGLHNGKPLTSYMLILSDGARCITASLSSQEGYAHLLATDQVVRHSVIRVPSYIITDITNTPGAVENALMVLRMQVVERDVGYVLGGTLPRLTTSCPVESILTAGAVRMLLEKECKKVIPFARKSQPVLQVVSDTCTISYRGGRKCAAVELSDGRDCIKALITSGADMALPSADLIIKHSIIRMESCMIEPGLVFHLPLEDRILLLGGVEVVARNVGHLIGNPAKAQKSINPTPGCSSPTSGLVRGSWSYDKKLQVAREHSKEVFRLLSDGSGDIGPAFNHLSSYFQLPREQTEPFRAAMLMNWRIMASNWPAFMKEQNNGQFTAEMVATYDRTFASDRTIGLLKRLSSVEGGESVLVRATASFIRGLTGVSYANGGSVSNALNCFRRFSVLVSECDLAELASACDLVSEEGGHGHRLILSYGRGKIVAESLVTNCAHYLSHGGGPSQRQVSSIFDPSPDNEDAVFFLSVGGSFCDCCGKTPEEANQPVLFKCKACRLAWYCSTSCQTECWANGHRDCCKKFGRFEKGDKVILEGLKKQPDLNGALVSVEDLPLNGRATVRIIPPMNRSAQVGAVLSIKKENLRHHRPLK